MTWTGGRTESEEFDDEDAHDFAWVARLAEDEPRLLRAVIAEVRELEDDDDWGGSVMFVTNIMCFRGFDGYPPYWYQEKVKQPPPQEDAPPKKVKKR